MKSAGSGIATSSTSSAPSRGRMTKSSSFSFMADTTASGIPSGRLGTSLESASRPSHTDSVASSDAPETERFLEDAARREGLTYHQFCQKYGIVGPSQERRIRRHEVLEADMKGHA